MWKLDYRVSLRCVENEGASRIFADRSDLRSFPQYLVSLAPLLQQELAAFSLWYSALNPLVLSRVVVSSLRSLCRLGRFGDSRCCCQCGIASRHMFRLFDVPAGIVLSCCPISSRRRHSLSVYKSTFCSVNLSIRQSWVGDI